VAARVTHAIRAGRELEVVRKRQWVELYGVGAGVQVVEMEVAVVVGDSVASVFEVDANVGHAGGFASVAVAGAFEHATDDEALLREQLIVHPHQGARFVGDRKSTRLNSS